LLDVLVQIANKMGFKKIRDEVKIFPRKRVYIFHFSTGHDLRPTPRFHATNMARNSGNVAATAL
jgi:hypothetical protein